MKRRPDEERGLELGWRILIAPVLLILVALLVLWDGPASRSPESAVGDRHGTTGNPRTPPPAGTVPAQPSASGYEYRVAEERYVVLQQDGQLQVQQRRRESWTAPDGWAWARQTGFDPARFVLPPSVDWKAIRKAEPTAVDVARVLNRSVASAPASERPSAEFNYVNDLLGTETLPASSLPPDYRRATVTALARSPRVTVKSPVADPLGRSGSTQISLTNPHSTLSIFLDADLQYLAYTGQGKDGERAFRVISDQRHVDRIPDDLLAQVGGDRVDKVIWE